MRRFNMCSLSVIKTKPLAHKPKAYWQKGLLLPALLLAFFGSSLSVQANGLDALATFLQTQKSGHASFTQSVGKITRADDSGKANSDAANNQGLANTDKAEQKKISKGEFAFLRPGLFRFDYHSPFAQSIIADGKTLWFYDVDLEQAGQKDQTQALGNTPVALIAVAQSVQDLEKRFFLQNLTPKDGLEWVEVKPKKADDPAFAEAQIGFRNGNLEKLIILDRFEQQTELQFGPFSDQVALEQFRFTPPPGVDVVSEF